MYEVKDKVVLVTGGATGIGADIVRFFLNEGAKHVAILDIDVNTGKAFETEMNAKYGANRSKFIKCDVTTDDLNTAYEQVLKETGYIDVVVNNAGIMNDSPNVYLKMIAVNVTALITSSLKAYELMRRDRGGKGGTIINISSIVALMQFSSLSVYSGTKSAVQQFSNCLGKEPHYSRSGVRVLSICFGATDTALLTRTKFGGIDKETDEDFFAALSKLPVQSSESAARGLVEAYKQGESGSTWLVTTNRPAEDITNNVQKAYEILGQGVFS
uniref:Alcohol dehydrogenase 8 n=1 Tax=Streltzoviella insularis TaxID=1206366 RepID=A0A7D5YY27_9NEOP|nr:alcohol dehydrogenase 8 [Streltzoviella insularis]